MEAPIDLREPPVPARQVTLLHEHEVRRQFQRISGCGHLFWHMTSISEFTLERVSQATWPALHNTR